jgi:hypothetical protein
VQDDHDDPQMFSKEILDHSNTLLFDQQRQLLNDCAAAQENKQHQ